MSNQIQIRPGFRIWGIQTLDSFNNILSTLMADYIALMTMIRTQNFETLHLVNRLLTEQVPFC
jgi:hypothetical protein